MANSFQGLRQHIERRASSFSLTPEFGRFYETIGDVETERIQALWTSLQEYVSGRLDEAAATAEETIRSMPDEEDGAGALVARTFAEAMLGRIRDYGGSGGNLYLGGRPPGAQLRAFELLRLRTPLIPFAYAAANRALLDLISKPTEVTLVDVGIGRGGQVRALLRNPSARLAFTRLHVVGIEPDSSATGAGALELARESVLRTAEEVGIEATFHGIPKVAEGVDASDLTGAGLTGRVIANAAFALHHVSVDAKGGDSNRDSVLRMLLDGGVEVLVLVEPDSNHFGDDIQDRFLFAYRHYGTVFKSLHARLAPADAALVWQEFFAPEVRNVIGHDGVDRTERHEESGRWVQRLRSGGWTVETPRKLVPRSVTPPGFDVDGDGEVFSLTYQGVSLLSAIRAQRK